jgi:hypothetical protein
LLRNGAGKRRNSAIFFKNEQRRRKNSVLPSPSE